LARFPGGDLQLAASHFRNAVEADPTYVAAWSGLADTYVRLRAFDAAEPALQQALELDPHSPEVLRIRGDLVLFRDWELAAAEADYRQAIAADPDSAEGYQHLAMVLAATGQVTLAIEQMEHAMKIEPVSTIIRADLGWYYYLAGEYDDSILQCRAALDIQPSLYFPHLCLLDAYVEQNRISDAVDQAKTILHAWGADPNALAGPADAALASFRRHYLELLDAHRQEYTVSPMDFAYAYAGLGDATMTLHWLSIAFEERDPGALFAAVNPVFAFLQHRREFERLLQSHKIALRTANGVADLPRQSVIEPDS
jgi:Tfp pilus assembly protein PilF